MNDPAFANHEWFTRGWTLQELIAPKEVLFFTERRDFDCQVIDLELSANTNRTSDWILLGKKSTMCERLSSITGIDAGVLAHARRIESISIAERMSWAAQRVTTRVEDRAYCLLGLFGVNIPMLYGEGEKAFIRLQEEIMKDTSDESLFAWRDESADPKALTGLLATSPSMFKDSGGFFSYHDWEPRAPFFKTNRGIQITLPLRSTSSDDLYIGALNCPRPSRTDGFAGVFLLRLTSHSDVESSSYHDQYARIRTNTIASIGGSTDWSNGVASGKKTTIYVRQDHEKGAPPLLYPEHILQLRSLPDPERYNVYIRSEDVRFRTAGERSIEPAVAPDVPRPLPFRQTRIPSHYRTTFRMSKQPNSLAAVVGFHHRDKPHLRFTVLLGSGPDTGDEVRAYVLDGWDTSLDWAGIFERLAHEDKNGHRTQYPEVPLYIRDDILRVKTLSLVLHSCRYFLVDISDISDRGYAPSPYRDPGLKAKECSGRFFWVKRLFKSRRSTHIDQ
jgi:hypothetical protein